MLFLPCTCVISLCPLSSCSAKMMLLTACIMICGGQAKAFAAALLFHANSLIGHQFFVELLELPLSDSSDWKGAQIVVALFSDTLYYGAANLFLLQVNITSFQRAPLFLCGTKPTRPNKNVLTDSTGTGCWLLSPIMSRGIVGHSGFKFSVIWRQYIGRYEFNTEIQVSCWTANRRMGSPGTPSLIHGTTILIPHIPGLSGKNVINSDGRKQITQI